LSFPYAGQPLILHLSGARQEKPHAPVLCCTL